ncbi:hypothetical protein H5410_035646 [Solanum commersonii]|uniref:Uncharacterized protein n=1 Tax=Solanum commersonii TaxID=4109 RepID=A0A9J5Y5S2_SOLCO|nr:hypothetical protein H5410_035646 [Solanum commersonii]
MKPQSKMKCHKAAELQFVWERESTPKDIGNISKVAFLYLTDNQLSGSIPAVLFNIDSLLPVSLILNSLSGPLLLDEGNIVSNLNFPQVGTRRYNI